MFGLIPRKKEKRVEGFWPYEPPMEVLRREFAPLFERMFGHWPGFAANESVPPYGPELEETAEAIFVREAVPGFEAKEIEVKISGNILTVHAERKAKEGDPLLFPEVGSNVCIQRPAAQSDDELFEGCDVVVDGTLVSQRLAASPLEPRASAAIFEGGKLTVIPEHGVGGGFSP